MSPLPESIASEILVTSPYGIFACAPDLRVILWNPRMAEITGLDPDRVLGLPMFEVFPFLIETGEDEKFHAALAGERVKRTDRPFRITQSDREGYYEATYAPLRDGSGAIVGMISFVHEITERRQAERRLCESEKRFRAMADAAPVLLWVTEADAQCSFVNRTWLEFTGRTIEEELGTGWADNIHPDDLDAGLQIFLEGHRTHRPFRTEYRLRRRDGSYRWLLEQSNPRFERDGTFSGFVGTCIDVQDFRDAEDRLRRMNEELEERVAERTEALARSNADLEQFAYVASHDLQQPLRMVSSYVRLLERRYREQLDDDAREFIGFAADGAERMQRLIVDLLAYSRVGQDVDPSGAVDSARALDQAIASLRAAIEESDARIERGALPVVRGHATLVVEVFQNLLGNAIKYAGGAPPAIHVDAEAGEGEWVFHVRDHGIGIEPSKMSRLFELFQRLHASPGVEGTGIGLATCKKIVERLGGRIWAESAPGEGSTFSFTLPQAEDESSDDFRR